MKSQPRVSNALIPTSYKEHLINATFTAIKPHIHDVLLQEFSFQMMEKLWLFHLYHKNLRGPPPQCRPLKLKQVITGYFHGGVGRAPWFSWSPRYSRRPRRWVLPWRAVPKGQVATHHRRSLEDGQVPLWFASAAVGKSSKHIGATGPSDEDINFMVSF